MLMFKKIQKSYFVQYLFLQMLNITGLKKSTCHRITLSAIRGKSQVLYQVSKSSFMG